jgi:CheY-like chemotaxis protein
MKLKMHKNIFLAEDDDDDCSIFQDALNDVKADVNLTITNDGVELLNYLDETVPPPPYVIFLDLNMPRKNGIESLKEIRQTNKLRDIPVVILSTSCNSEMIDRTYNLGANYYICKPPSYRVLSKLLEKVLSLDPSLLQQQPSRKEYVLVA